MCEVLMCLPHDWINGIADHGHTRCARPRPTTPYRVPRLTAVNLHLPAA